MESEEERLERLYGDLSSDVRFPDESRGSLRLFASFALFCLSLAFLFGDVSGDAYGDVVKLFFSAVVCAALGLVMGIWGATVFKKNRFVSKTPAVLNGLLLLFLFLIL